MNCVKKLVNFLIYRVETLLNLIEIFKSRGIFEYVARNIKLRYSDKLTTFLTVFLAAEKDGITGRPPS